MQHVITIPKSSSSTIDYKEIGILVAKYLRKEQEKKDRKLYNKEYYKDNKKEIVAKRQKTKEENEEKVKQLRHEQYMRSREKLLKKRKEDYYKNREKKIAIVKKSNKKNAVRLRKYEKIVREELKDTYIKKILKEQLDIETEAITPVLIELKKAQIKLKRTINKRS